MVLVVEDDEGAREALRDLLDADGFVVRVARDGVAALAELLRKRPCVMLLDLMMPRLSGWRLWEKLQEDPVLSTVPVCFLTALPDQAPRGGVGVVAKPFDSEEILAVARRHCSHHP